MAAVVRGVSERGMKIGLKKARRMGGKRLEEMGMERMGMVLKGSVI